MSKFRKHLIYWILPSIVVGLCMGIYFFDIFGMSYLIAPEFNREFGILENIQLLIIFAIILLSFNNSKKAKTKPIRFIFILILIGSIFIFLEEIDYGLNYYEYFSGTSNGPAQIASGSNNSIRNIHNQGNLTRLIKFFGYLFFVLIIVFPFLLKRIKIKNKYLDYFAPEHYFIYTLLSMILLNQAAEYIDDLLKNSEISALNSNVSEFEEVFIYYIVFLLVLEKGRALLAFEEQGSNKEPKHDKI